MARLVADIECNGFKPDRIWVLGIYDLDLKVYQSYVGDDEVPNGLLRLLDADIVVGHYFKGFDAKVIRDLTEGLVNIPNEKIHDTVEIGRALFPNMPDQKLQSWGEILGFPKLDYDGGFDEFNPDMVPYCQRDVELNAALYEFFLAHIESL